MKKMIFAALIVLIMTACNQKNVNRVGGMILTVTFGQANSNKDKEISMDIMKERLKIFGVESPKIKEIENGLYQIEVPLQTDTTLIKALVAAKGKFEICETYEGREVFHDLNRINKIISGLFFDKKISARYYCQNKNFFFCNNLIPGNIAIKGPVIGYAGKENLLAIDSMLSCKEIKDSLNPSIAFRWTFDAASEKFSKKLCEECKDYNSIVFYTLIAVKSSRDKANVMDGSMVADAEAKLLTENNNNITEIQIRFKKEGSKAWAEVTKDNIGKSLALMIDGRVYAYPVVQTEISSGNVSVTGDFSLNEAKKVAAILKYGEMPVAPVIVKTEVIIK